uniref:Uncharacterized protein n=1 Tax=Cannabis sativa TaxID=3483 RepID=A0A803NSI3_CANSA
MQNCKWAGLIFSGQPLRCCLFLSGFATLIFLMETSRWTEVCGNSLTMVLVGSWGFVVDGASRLVVEEG